MIPDETTRQALIALIPRLRRFARVLTGSIADADDVVQAALEKAMVKLDQFQPGTRFDAWVFRIARNHWVDDRRRAHNRMGHDDIGEMLDLAGDDGVAVVEASAEARMVRAAVDSLPPEQRDVVALVMLEELSYREAADLLGLPIGTVMSRLSRAKASALPAPANDTGRGSWRWPQFGAMAASLALGVLIGGPLLTGGGDAPAGEGLVLASADLTPMLDTAPSGQRVDLAALGEGEVVLTFRNADGALCRQFMLEGPNGTSDALACAGGGADKDWRIEAYGLRPAPVGEMKLAGGDAAAAVVAAVDAMIDSDPLVGADERAELGKK